MRRKIISIAIALTMTLAIGVNAFAVQKTDNFNQKLATITMNGTKLSNSAIIIGGTVYIPVRTVCEALGYKVTWSGADKQNKVTTTLDKASVVLDIVNQKITVNGEESKMMADNAGAACIIENGTSYLKSAILSKTYNVAVQYDEKNQAVTLTTCLKPDVKNTISVNDIAAVILAGNPTTGYDWHYKIGDESIIKLNNETSIADSNLEGLVGAGETHEWFFTGLKAGETTITFKYYRSWEGEGSATKTIVYKVEVK